MDLATPTGMYKTPDYTQGTIDKRDVSEMLELWAHTETPLLNKISWGAESGARGIEWVHEHLGWRYIEISGTLATNGTVLLAGSGVGGLSQAEQTKQIRVGTVLFAQGVADSGEVSGDHGWFVVSTIGSSYSVTGAWIASHKCSLAASTKMYIVAGTANEGSTPDRDTSRIRTLLSNKMTILRQDIRITGSQMATDMHAVNNELSHQTRLRLLELQKDREMAILFSKGQARTTSAAGLMEGMAELFIDNQTETWVDTSTTTLTETTFNDLVAEMAENGTGTNLCAVGAFKQIRKFTGWSADRIRTKVDDRLGGQYITSYLTDTGKTVDLVPMVKFPVDWLFVLDVDKIKLRALKGRKLLLEKLGKVGDYEEWQLLSEFSMEHHGVAQGQHGAFFALS
jgi:hypothetical protein